MNRPHRVAIIFDDTARPETTGTYCRSALSRLAQVTHLRPSALEAVRPDTFDLFVRIDDGLDLAVPANLHPLIWWAIDTHLDFSRCLRQALTADVTFAAQKVGAAALTRAGVPTEWLPLGCDPEIHRPHTLAKRFDVGFVGHLFPGPRTELLAEIRRRYPNHFIGQCYFDEMARIYSECRTVFNRSLRDDLNMRVFEALACGSLLVTDELGNAGQAEYFHDGVHLATYRSQEELFDKIAYYLAHPMDRERISAAGRRAVIDHHTYFHRMERIMSAAAALPRIVPVAAPTQNSSTVGICQDYFDHARPELLQLIPTSAIDVLDLGCGTGRLGSTLKARQSARVTGVELDSRAAAVARERLDAVLEADIETELPLAMGSFDAVICGDILEHLRDPLTVLRRIRRWLRPAGMLIASLPNIRHHSVISGLLNGDWTYEPAGLLDRTHLRFVTRREIDKLLFRAGFTDVCFWPVPGPGYDDWVATGRPGQVAVGGLRIGPLPISEAEEFFTYQWLVTARPAVVEDCGLTSIIVLAHNQFSVTRQCLDSLFHVTDEPYELILVDNGSTDGTTDFFTILAATRSNVRMIRNATNLGFPAGVNQGIRAATGRNFLLLNNDTVLPTGWLTRLLRALHSDPSLGLVGPCSNNVSGDQQVTANYDDLGRLDGFAWEWGRAHAGVVEKTNRLVGFCLLIRRTVIDAVGLFDERYGLGNFEDDDFCRRACKAGFRLGIARDAFVHHYGGQTFRGAGIDFDALMRTNEALFRAKWATPESLPPDSAYAARSHPTGGLLLEPVDPELSVCLIVRDNVATLRACLESIRPWVDEMIVVDTGSVDDTPELAASLGARVFHFPWCDNFSAARNESLRHARGRWLFWMDSDDTIDEVNGRGLRNLVRGPHDERTLGYVVRVHCPGPGASDGRDVTVVDHVKVIRNRPDLRFDGRIHEQILPAIRAAGGDVGWTELFVVHSGYDHSPSGQDRKAARDLKLLHLELSERPGHPFTLFNLGMTYADLGHFSEAGRYLQDSIARSGDGDSHLRKAFALLSHALARSNEPKAAIDACHRGLAMFPGDLELTFRLGILHQEAGRPADAVAAYEAVLADRGDRYFTSVDRDIGGFKARQNLAVALTDLGRFAEAADQWQCVVNDAPRYHPGWRGLGEALLRVNPTEASELAERLVADPVLRTEGYLLLGHLAEAVGKVDIAREQFALANRTSPTDPAPPRELARLAYSHGDFDSALRFLADVVRLDPADAIACHNLGTVALNLGQADTAVRAFAQSLAIRPAWPPTLVGLGSAWTAAGNPTAADGVWQRLLHLAPGHPVATAAINAATRAN